MKTIAIYILIAVTLLAVAPTVFGQTAIPDGARETQVYSRAMPTAAQSDSQDIMTNFNIYHYYGKVVGIKELNSGNTLGVAYVYAKDDMDLETLVDKLAIDVALVQELEDGISYYGKSLAGMRSVYIDGQEINIQIVSNKENIIVGFPLIMGSY